MYIYRYRYTYDIIDLCTHIHTYRRQFESTGSIDTLDVYYVYEKMKKYDIYVLNLYHTHRYTHACSGHRRIAAAATLVNLDMHHQYRCMTSTCTINMGVWHVYTLRIIHHTCRRESNSSSSDTCHSRRALSTYVNLWQIRTCNISYTYIHTYIATAENLRGAAHTTRRIAVCMHSYVHAISEQRLVRHVVLPL